MRFLDRVLQKWRIGMVKPHVRAGARVLDVGSAEDGQLFRQVPGIGAFVGIDPDIEGNHDIASNARLLRGHFPQALESEEPFDVIAMLAVLEHVPPPDQHVLAANCARHLVPGGKVILTVPSPAVDAILAVLRFVGLVDAATLEQHYGFRPSQAKGVFEAAGLRLAHHRRFQLGLNNLFVFEKPEGSPSGSRQESRPTRSRLGLWTSTMALAFLAVGYIAHGTRTIWKAEGTDLHKRHIEQRYVLNRQNPYDVSETLIARSRGEEAPSHPGRSSTIDPRIGMYGPGGYPPWAFFAGFALILPFDIRGAKIWFIFLNAVALGIAGLWAYRLGRPHGRIAGAFLASACLAIFAQGSSLRLGQYGIIVNALLIGMWWAEERRWQVRSGLSLAMAMVKPTSSALFGWILLWRRNYVGVAVGLLAIALMSTAVGVVVHTSPLEMMAQMASQSGLWVQESIGLPGILIRLGVPKHSATAALAVSGFAMSGILAWRWRNAGLLVGFSIAAVIGRLWSYHRQYDDVMLLFPLAQLALLWLEGRRFIDAVNLLLFGASLWVPLRLADFTPGVQALLCIIWTYGLAAILRAVPPRQLVIPQP